MSKRLVVMGDSLPEGVGDDDPAAPNGVRGWADRVAEQLAAREPGFRYANLAVRGKLLPQVLGEQLEPGLALEPDLVSLYAGGNDLMRPKVDIDALLVGYETAVARIRATGARLILFTGVDGVEDPLFRARPVFLVPGVGGGEGPAVPRDRGRGGDLQRAGARPRRPPRRPAGRPVVD